MFKTLVAIVSMLFFLNAEIALADMVTAEKWLCVNGVAKRVLRLYAPAKGEAPCKVFFTKRTPEDPNDVAMEAREAAGEVKPIYYSTGNGGFCVRMYDRFLKEKQDREDWICTKE